MISEIKEFINNINIGYVILCFLFLAVSLLFLSKKTKKGFFIKIFILLYLILSCIGFIYFNDFFNNIFHLNYLSMKLYLVLIIIGNIIMLVNINFHIKKYYKLINYMLFITNFMIAFVNLWIVLSNKYNFLIVADLKDSLKLMNINFIIFIIYLYCLCFIYIMECTIDFVKKKVSLYQKKDLNIPTSPTALEKVEHSAEPLLTKPKYTYSFEEKKASDNAFYIDGVDCSAIFEDSNQEEVLKNYYILLNDVNAKLTNGYTIREYTKIKKIINKLNIKDFDNFNINVQELNKISHDEYNLLKKYLKGMNSKKRPNI